METLKQLDILAGDLLKKLPDLMQAGTVYANDLMHRFILYVTLINGVTILLNILGIIILSVITYKFYGFCKKNLEVWESGVSVFLIGSSLFIYGIFVVELVDNIIYPVKTIIKIQLVPEIYIIDYFKE